MADDNYSVAQAIFDGLTQRGVQPNVAYGALGSLMGESGRTLNPNSVASGDGSDGSDSIGFGQWNGSRAQNLRSTAQSMGLGWNAPQAQVAHLFNELDGKYGKTGNYSSVLKALQGGQSVSDGNSIWTRNYEVPANIAQQIALRQAHGDALAQGASQGTLDLSKVGSFANGSQNVQNGNAFQALAPGALSASGLSGSDGALWGMVNQPDQQRSLGNRLAMAGAALASISSPSQGQALASMANQNKPQQTSQADKLIKFLQLKQAVAKSQQGNALSFQGTLKDGTPYYTDPTSGKVVDSSGQPISNEDMQTHNQGEDKAPPRGIAQLYGDTQNRALQAANIADKAQAIRQQLRDHPELANQLNGATGAISWVNNQLGESTDMSALQKDIVSLVNQHMLSVGQSVKGAQTGKVLDSERNSVAPNGALSDAVLTDQALKRIYDRQQEIYAANANTLSSLGQQYPKGFKFNDPKTGNETTWDDYNKSRYSNWSEADKNIDAGTQSFLDRHDVKTGKKKPASFLDLFSSGN